MITVTKKQASVALVITAFATIMIAGSIAPSMNNAFAWGNHFGHFGHFGVGPFNYFDFHGKRFHGYQSINQGCIQPSSTIGFHSGNSQLSGNSVPTCVNINLGGNALSNDQSFR